MSTGWDASQVPGLDGEFRVFFICRSPPAVADPLAPVGVVKEVAMKARIKWIENVAFLAESGSGHAVLLDGAPDAGGRNLGPRPMEMLLLGLGGCTAFDVVHILRRGREQVTDCVVEIEAERAEADPKVFTKIHMHYVVTGRGLAESKVARAISLSAEKYCSASIILGKTAEITHDWTVIDEAAVSAQA
jgi:putative redox protein